ncbi:MAG: ABC transporter permease [Bifidobacteriaceae bacterium]|jgi:putative ABC transport system permease protein|nr:ABC transporter permease [Bifidobacteriaceae bacterium]
MVALTIALGASVGTAMLGVMFDIGDKVNAELKTYGANIAVQGMGAAVLGDLYEAEGAGLGPRSALKEAEIPAITTIFWAHNIVDFAPFLDLEASLTRPGRAGPGLDVAVVGTWFNRPIADRSGGHGAAGLIGLRSWWEVQGGWIADQDRDLAMVGSAAAARASLRLGDTLELTALGAESGAEPGAEPGETRRVRVAGIFTSGGEEDQSVVLPLAVAQELAGRPGEADRLEVSALTTPDNDLARKAARDPDSLTVSERETWYCTAYVSSIAYQIEEVLTGAVAKPVRQVAESEGAILAKTQLLMVLVTLLALAASALGIANLVTASVMERSAEIGLLKAVGARDGGVIRLVLTELAAVGAVGGLAGYGLGLALAQAVGHAVFGSAISVRPVVAPLVAALVALVVIVGSAPSVRALVRLRPADVLHGR